MALLSLVLGNRKDEKKGKPGGHRLEQWHFLLSIFGFTLLTWAGPHAHWVVRSVLTYFTVLSSAVSFFFFARAVFLRILFEFRPWVQDANSISTMVWEFLVMMLHPKRGTPSYFQAVLPTMPLPSLDRTLDRYLHSVRPFFSQEKLAAVAARKDAVLTAEGRRLQARLSRQAQLETMWRSSCHLQKDVREPRNAFDCMYYLLDKSEIPEGAKGLPATRAAALTMRLLDFMGIVANNSVPCKALLSRGAPSIPGVVPRCTNSFKSIFGSVLSPGNGKPTVLHRPAEACSAHIAVLCRGGAILVPIRDEAEERISEERLSQLMEAASTHASRKGNDAPNTGVDSLSWLSWDAWEEAITHLDSLKGGASEAWNKLQHAAVVVSLETRGSVPQTRGKGLLSQHAHSILCGSNQSCQGGGWIKNLPFILVVLADGYAGLRCSSTLAEPHSMTHVWEYALTKEAYPLSAAGSVRPCSPIVPLPWRVPPALHAPLAASRQAWAEACSRLDLEVMHVRDVGRRQIRDTRVHSALFLNLAVQLALYRLQGRAGLVLDRVSTTTFALSTHDWVRTVTAETVQLLKTMSSRGVGKGTRKGVVRACESIMRVQREAMEGKAVEFHLQALSLAEQELVGKGGGAVSQLLAPDMVPPPGGNSWLVPNQQNKRTAYSKLSLGGSLGVELDGGCSVGLAAVGEDELYLHVRCWRGVGGGGVESASRMAEELGVALRDLLEVMER